MGKDRINIPVSVTGAPQAQEELKGVKGAVEDLGNEEGKHEQRKRASAGATEEAAKAQKLFNEQGKAAITSVLARINPELAALATVAMNVARGFSQMNVALPAIAGAGAVLGGLLTMLRSIGDEAQRVADVLQGIRDAAREGRAEGLNLLGQVQERFKEAGVGGGAAVATEAAARAAKEQNIPLAMGIEAELAGAVRGKPLDDVERTKFLAGLFATNKAPEYTRGAGADAKNRALIERMIETGSAQVPQKAFEAYRQERKPITQAEAPWPEAVDSSGRRKSRNDLVRDELRTRYGLTAREIEVAEARDRGEPRAKFRRWGDWFTDPRKGPFPWDPSTESEGRGNIPSGAAIRSFGAIEDALRQVKERLDRDVGPARSMLPITVYQNVTNVQVQNVANPSDIRRNHSAMLPELMDGGGVVD